MRAAIVCVALLAVCASAALLDRENPVDYSYDEYLVDFGKTHTSNADYSQGKRYFEMRVAEIIRHNADPSQTWKMGVNKFTDMTRAERAQYFGYNSQMTQTMMGAPIRTEDNQVKLEDIPASVDWRDKKVVTAVKDQGGCGSCWAFAAVETIESALIQATGKTLLLSTQNMVSCTPNPQHCGGTGGCSGATSELGYQYVADKGIASEKDYPYRAVTGKCDETKPKSAHIGGFVKLIENNYTDLITSLATIGPIAVSVDAEPWMSYSSGIFTGCGTSRIDINHAVQAVGYGEQGGKPYWIIRNSWGSFWGESGYIRLFRHADGDMKWCGIDPSPQDGTGCDGGPPQVTVCGSCGVWYDSSYPTKVSL